jgi:hypothetical protein
MPVRHAQSESGMVEAGSSGGAPDNRSRAVDRADASFARPDRVSPVTAKDRFCPLGRERQSGPVPVN